MAAVALEKAVALGIALYLPRHLGLADYGRYALLVSYLGLFQALPDAGLEAVLVTRLAQAGGAARGLAGRGAYVRLAVSLAGAVTGLAVLGLVTGDHALVGAGAVAAAGLAVQAGAPYRVLLRAELRLAAYVALVGAQAVLALLFLAGVVRAGGDLVPVLAAVSAAAAAGVVLGRLIVGAGVRLAWDGTLARALVAAAWPLAATTVSLVAAYQVLQLVLLDLYGAAAVGLLAGAQRLVDAANLLPQALMLSVLPELARVAGDPTGAATRARAAARALVVVLGPVAAALALYAGPLLALALGAPFAVAAPTLRVLAPVVVLGATGSVIANLLVAAGLQRTLLHVTLASALLMVGLGSVAIPALGAMGAAAAIGLAMAAGQGALVALSTTRGLVAPVLAGTARPLACAALAALVALALGGTPAAAVALLLGGYAALLAATGSVTRADVAHWRR